MANDNPVPNPEKRVQTKFPIETVKSAVKSLPDYATSATLTYFNDAMGFCKFTCKGSGLLNFGMFLELSLIEIDQNKTEVLLECRRQIGWINLSTEYDECVNYMGGCIGLLGKVLTGEAQKAVAAGK